ncbi:unnamed protein product [marine sediment metagenome]|uniref:AMMECR1 domain-containing protein n=1 Tax=marine sediment metagenome TaxID=412755 RepID=X0ZS10_9ZZZZ
MDKYVELAKKAVEKYIKVGKVLSHKNILEEFTKEKTGVFVSIKKKGELRVYAIIFTFHYKQDLIRY